MAMGAATSSQCNWKCAGLKFGSTSQNTSTMRMMMIYIAIRRMRLWILLQRLREQHEEGNAEVKSTAGSPPTHSQPPFRRLM